MNEFIKSNNLFLIDHGITHVKNDSVSQFDANDLIINFSKSDGPFTHHHFLISALKIFIPSSTRSNFSYRNLEKIDAAAFSSDLGLLDWQQINEYTNVDDMLN